MTGTVHGHRTAGCLAQVRRRESGVKISVAPKMLARASLSGTTEQLITCKDESPAPVELARSLSAPPTKHVTSKGQARMASWTLIEILILSLLTRALLKICSVDRTIHLLDLVPRRSRAAMPPEPSAERWFRLAGACLGRSIARSQFLRLRGHPHVVVIGVQGGIDRFAAHAWLDPYDSPQLDFVELRRFHR